MAGTTKRVAALLGSVSVLTLLSSALLSPASAQVTMLDAITIIATKTEELAINTLAPVSTIHEEQIQQLQPTRTNQLFFGIPGVSTEASPQEASTAINIRGMQDFGRVAVYIDGARQNYARLGHNGAGSFFLETEILAQADIVRGPTANIYGSGAIGGVVTMRTKDVEDILKAGQPWGIQVNGTAGTNGFNGVGSIFAAARISPNAEFILGGSYRHQDSYKSGNGTKIPNSGQEVATFLAKATFRPADDHQIKLGTVIYNSNWLNGPLTGSVIRDFEALNATTTANWKYRPVGNPLFDFDGTVYWNRVDVTSLVVRDNGALPGFYGPVGTRTNYLIDTVGFDANNTSRFETGPFRHALTYGIDLFHDTVKNTAQAGFGPGYNPSGERQVFGGFVQLKTNYSTWLEFVTALRYDNYSLSGLDITTGNSVSNSGDRLSPKFTIGITPFAGFQPYISYAEGYRAPAVTETLVSEIHPSPAQFTFQPNPNLRPEIGKNLELGFNIKRDGLFTPDDKFRLKASIYQNRVTDFIDTVTECRFTIVGPPGPPCFSFGPMGPQPNFANWVSQYRNVSQAEIKGAEFEAMYDQGTWFVGLAGHHIRGRDLVGGDPLAKIPADMLALTLGHRFMDGRLNVAVRWTAVAAKTLQDLPTGTAANVQTSSYNLVNLYIGYQIDPSLQLAFSVENLLDEQYTVYTHEYASPGLTAKISLRKTFGPAPDLTAVNNLQTAQYRPQAAR